MNRALAVAAALLLGGCYAPANIPARIVSSDENGIVIRSGMNMGSDNMAALHCQHFGKLMVPNGAEQLGNQQVMRYYVCR